MGRLGPFDAGRTVVAGVSGGADSMALALLLRDWGRPLAVVVDHGLRAESAAEAALTLDRLAAMGVPARLVTLRGLAGPGLGERARAARYDALLAVCRETGRPDLVVGHHRRDQVETVQLRRARGSGAAGLAGMAAVGFRADARVLRPFLAVEPGRLRATLVAAGVAWVEDPGNHNPRTARGALRAGPAGALDSAAGAARTSAEQARAEALARAVAIGPAGYAALGEALSAGGWSDVAWTVSGGAHPPRRAGLAGLAAGGTVSGVRASGGYVMREAAAMGAAVPGDAVWDGRFRLRRADSGAVLGALGGDAVRLRRRGGFPSAVLRASPAVRLGAELFSSSHLAYAGGETWPSVQVDFRPARPLAGAPFVPA